MQTWIGVFLLVVAISMLLTGKLFFPIVGDEQAEDEARPKDWGLLVSRANHPVEFWFLLAVLVVTGLLLILRVLSF